jgi:hypothetical protein
MSDSNVWPGGATDKERLTDEQRTKREIFLRFHYADLKDSFKQLFALISIVFVFSASFGQNIITAASVIGYWKAYQFSPYVLFILSLAVCSVGYYMLGVAGDKATNLKLWKYWLPYWNNMEFDKCMLWSSWAFDISGGLFLLGLFLLVCVAFF